MSNGYARNTAVFALVIALVIVVAGGVFARGAPEADRPMRLTLYGSTQEMGVDHVVSEFEAQTGIEVSWIRMSTGETLNRLRAEANNPQASVWFAGPGTAHMVGASEGLTQPYCSPVRSEIDPRYIDEDCYWTGAFVTTFAFTSNPRLLEEYGLDEPSSYYDILTPEWANQIAVSNPGTSGTAYLWLATLVQLLGEEAAFEYFRGFNANAFQFPRSGMAPALMAGRAEIAMGITMSADSYYLIAEEGYDLTIAYPREGVGFSIEPVSIIAGAPEPEAAQIFVDWLLSADGQRAIYGVFAYPTVVGTNTAAIPPASEAVMDADIPFMDFDIAQAAADYDRLIRRFEDEILQQR